MGSWSTWDGNTVSSGRICSVCGKWLSEGSIWHECKPMGAAMSIPCDDYCECDKVCPKCGKKKRPQPTSPWIVWM